MTAEHEGVGEYGGMDALMAAITGDPLPEEARQDPALLAEHREAEADLAVLKAQLGWLAEALTGETEVRTGEAEGTEQGEAEGTAEREAKGEAERDAKGEASASMARPGRTRSVSRRPEGPAGSARPGRFSDRRPESLPGPTRPTHPTRLIRPAHSARPGRPSGRRRAVRIALGSLAGAAAFALVVGFGWMVTHSPGSADSGARAASDAKRAPVQGADSGRPADPALELACSRLVVEGAVTQVEPEKGTARNRVTLTVTHSYKPAHGPAEVSFLLDGGARPAPRTGQHVLVTVRTSRQHASLWAVGDTRVAADRAWITEALPDSLHTACPSGEAP
ncbi:hypothetical protein [Streptomyces sp. CoH27]|uniref:hypothetical protein n=1 Tax=Streptomyces sp. CoH27 TaxID=2875763 RepID=UPI001CD6D83E|nr:hypothetical protein [Streptomyces sp. CoH27]